VVACNTNKPMKKLKFRIVLVSVIYYVFSCLDRRIVSQ